MLRLTGEGREYPLFIASPSHPDYLLANPGAVKRLFSNPDAAPSVSIETSFFAARKPAGALRIFVQGGSSAAGFPYGLGASLAGMLEQRLRRAHPRREIEVVSTALAAVNSYALLAFADEIIAQQPDAVLIYAGHNEFLGILGVGSTFSSGASRRLTLLDMKLRELRVYQALEGLYARLRSAEPTLESDGATLMARVAKERRIPYGSRLYERGIAQFRGNLRDLLAKYRRAGIPAYVGTLASNERDQPPFTSALDDATDTEQWRATYSAAVQAFEAGALERAAAGLDAALALDDGHAEAWYQRARVHETLGDLAAAREAYRAAKDRDQLRFRAPEVFNELIREIAAEHGAVVVDVQQAMATASEHGIVGSELMLEHLHPNVDGYFILADAYYDVLVATGLVEPAGLDERDARRHIPLSAVDELFGEHKIRRITADWPFQVPPREPEIPPPTNPVESLAQQLYRQEIAWPQAHAQLQALYRKQGESAEYTRVALILADAVPWMARQQYTAGTALIEQNRQQEALRYLLRATRLEPGDTNALLALSHALILTGEHGQARVRLGRVLELDPGNRTATEALAQLDRLQNAP